MNTESTFGKFEGNVVIKFDINDCYNGVTCVLIVKTKYLLVLWFYYSA